MPAKPEALPRLLDCKGIMDELAVKRATAEAIMRQLDKVQVPGVRRVYVKRDDVRRLLDESTIEERPSRRRRPLP